MARIHRKLFPALTTINQTQDCTDFCDPACPYNCYSYPDYYYFPPPPPPLPPLSAAEHSSLGNHIPSYFIILASLFVVIFVVLGFYVIKTKCYADWCGWRGNGPAPSQLDSSEEEFLDENQVDHPIWFITTNGLRQSIINSITVCKYRKGEGLIEGTECSVCLNEFQENETLRLLPKCNHAFHIPCIDTWLSSHTNCPLCRAGIVSNSVRPEAAISNMGSTELSSNNLGINRETQTENSQNEVELSNNMAVIGTGVSANRAGTGEAQDSTDESITKEHPNVERNQVVQVISDLDEHHQFLSNNIQNEIRSMSMDSRLASSSCRGPGCITEPESHSLCHTEDNPEPQAAMFEASRRSSIAKCLHISPVSMKRSFSCNGRILSTRGCRSLDTSLPY